MAGGAVKIEGAGLLAAGVGVMSGDPVLVAGGMGWAGVGGLGSIGAGALQVAGGALQGLGGGGFGNFWNGLVA